MSMIGPAGNNPAQGVINVLQAQNQILTAILAAIQKLQPGSLIGGGPQTAQTITANGQTILVGTNGSAVLTTTTGANMTGMILGQGTVASQHFTIINESAFTITFAVSGTSNVFGTPTQSAQVAQTYIWDSTNSLWRQVA